MGFDKIRFKELLYKYDKIIKLILVYRYVSLVIASLFYFYNDAYYNTQFKIGVLLSLVIASTILNYLYVRHRDKPKHILILIVIETISNILLIIPTGLLNSPYLWYSLNTVILCAFLINIQVCVLNLIFYIGAIKILLILINNTSWLINFNSYNSEFNYVLSLFLNVILVLILAKYLRRTFTENILLTEVNIKLERADRMNKEMMSYIVEVQRALNVITIGESIEDVCKYLVNITNSLLDGEITFFYDVINDELLACTQGVDAGEYWNKIKIYRNNIRMNYIDNFMGGNLLIIPIKTAVEDYGELMIYRANNERIHRYNSINIIKEISAMAFDRLTYLKNSRNYIIAKEQKRIAGEIHDNALQRLFGLSCNLFSLVSNEEIKDPEILNRLKEFRITLNGVMRDIRTTIYAMSYDNSKYIMSLRDSINEYISNYKDTNIEFVTEGDLDELKELDRQYVYRIISEGVANAIRHGKAQNVFVGIDISCNNKTILIKDDGVGFNNTGNFKGLGLKNMKTLTNLMNGVFYLNTDIGKGTELKIIIPIKHIEKGGITNESSIS